MSTTSLVLVTAEVKANTAVCTSLVVVLVKIILYLFCY